MELRQLKTFQAVATLLSFNRAAEKLHYSQSTVSAQIQSLEDELKVPLFDRLGRRVLLTEAGEKLLAYASRLCELSDEAVSEVTGTQPQGSITVRVPETLGIHVLPEVIRRFGRRFPSVSLSLVTCAADGLDRDLRKGLIDMALLFGEGIHSADLKAVPLAFQEVIIVAAPSHPLARQECVETAAFAGERLLFSATDCGYPNTFKGILLEAGVRPGSVVQFNSLEAIRVCVREGIGITALPRLAAQRDLDCGSMAPIAWKDGPLETAVLMIWHQSKWLSPALLGFMDCIRECLPGALPCRNAVDSAAPAASVPDAAR